MTEVLWDVRLFDPATGEAAERQVITLAGDTIASIDEVAGDPPPGARDLGGATALPGLIDAHSHIISDTTRSPGFGPPPVQHGEPPRPTALGHYILAATADRMLRSGFTAVRDVGCYDDESTVLKLAIETGIVPGPRVYTCGRIVSATSPGGDIFGTMYREADGPWDMRQAVREQLRRGADFIKFMATGARSVVLEDPEPPQMTLEEMEAIVDEAHRMGRRVAAHAEGLEGTRLALEAGADTIEHGLSLHREPRLLDGMAERGTVLVPTLSTFHDLAERFVDDFAPVLVDQAKRQLDEALLTVQSARSAGVTMALGYDSGPPGTSAQELLRLIGAGLSATEALRAATVGGAAAIGRVDLGRVAVGCRADVVVIDGRPDENPTLLTQPESIRLVIGRGVAFA
jgi:imidazolonepropionase-like amidohydrolase